MKIIEHDGVLGVSSLHLESEKKEILNIKVEKKNPEMIVSYSELEAKIIGKNWKPNPEYKKIYTFLTRLKSYLEDKYSNDVDPIAYLYHLYYDLKLSTIDIYDKLDHLWVYEAKKYKDSFKRVFKDIFNWSLDWKNEKKTIWDKKVHILWSQIDETSGKIRNILEEDYEYLHSKWITKPSKVDAKKILSLDEVTQGALTRYKHLALNKIFLERNKISFQKTQIAMESWVSNWKKDLINEFDLWWINKEIISYPLNQIFIHITENINLLKGDNKKQLEVAKKFKIWNLWTFYRIVKWLWILDNTWWKLINLSVEKFEKLINWVNDCESNSKDINWDCFLNLWLEIWIKNPQHLHTGLSALWITQKYGLPKIQMSNNKHVLKIRNHILNKYWESITAKVFFNKEVDNIISDNKKILPKNYEDQTRAVISVLRFFWYHYGDTRQSTSNKGSIIHTRPIFFR